MANPSLQIGNSNWAIKEDDLLGYSTVGTNYLPKPMTMTRASAGTRVNSEGLVETVELLGSELVTNGDFATDGTPSTNTWTLGWYSNTANVSISGGKITLTNSASESDSRAYATNGVSSNNILITNQLYKLQYEVIANNGVTSFKYYSSGGVFIDAPIDLGVTHTIYIKNTSNQLFLFQNATTNSNISLDNVSLKETTIDNLARVDYTDGTSSLLSEPIRTNNIQYSEDFTQSYWRKDKVTVTPNSIISPSGQLDASLIQETVYTGGIPSFDLLSSITLSAGTYTYTFYVKNNNGRYLGISFGSSAQRVRTNFDFTTNTFKTLVFSGTTTGTASFTTLGDFYRISITATFPSSTAADTVLIPLATDTYPFYAFQDSDNRSFYLWGAQLEQDSYATSYIPTSGSTVTRVQDQYSKTGISNLINSEEGVLFIEMAALYDGSSIRLIGLNDGSDLNRVFFYFRDSSGTNPNRVRTEVISGGSSQYSSYNTIPNSGSLLDFNKIAVKWKVNDIAIWINGTEVDTDTSALAPIGLKSLDFSTASGSLPFSGKVKQLQVYKTALTDTELKTLTT